MRKQIDMDSRAEGSLQVTNRIQQEGPDSQVGMPGQEHRQVDASPMANDDTLRPRSPAVPILFSQFGSTSSPQDADTTGSDIRPSDQRFIEDLRREVEQLPRMTFKLL